MFVLKVVSISIAAILAGIQIIKDYKDRRRLIFLVLIILALGVTIVAEVLDAEDKEGKHTALITKSDSTLRKTDSTLESVNDNLKFTNLLLVNTDTSINRLARLQKSAQNVSDSLREILLRSKVLLETQKEVLNKNKLMLTGQNELLTIYLMDKVIVPAIRIVFSFKNPEYKEKYKGPKFVSDQYLIEHGDFGRFIPINSNDIFPQSSSLGHNVNYMRYRLYVEGFVDSRRGIDPAVGDAGTNTYYYLEKDGRYCHAFEFKNLNRQMNLSEFYTNLKSAKSEIFIEKKYKHGTSKAIVEENEIRFLSQGLEFYLESPLNHNTGTWARIYLRIKGTHVITRETDDYGSYYSVKYSWEPVKSTESIIVYQ